MVYESRVMVRLGQGGVFVETVTGETCCWRAFQAALAIAVAIEGKVRLNRRSSLRPEPASYRALR
jgi:hypothetical protein